MPKLQRPRSRGLPQLFGVTCKTGGVTNLLDELSRITETDSSTRRRGEYSSDASNYRVVPLAVTFPRDGEEVLGIHRVCRELGVPVTARGAGTSVAGNAVGDGVIIDYSRYMNKIISIDPEARTARVQPGVIMTDLQAAAKPYGLWFGPDPSTKNRATFGGMIGNNACGPHALVYGRTADNVVSLEVVDGLGRHFEAGTDLGKVPGLEELVSKNLAPIRTELGRFTRQVSGYSLEHLLPEKGGNLAKTLVGTEGTCVSVLEATVQLHPLPPSPLLVVLGYEDMIAAARAVPGLLPVRPEAIEGMDSRLVEVVRRAKGSVPQLPGGSGWLFCEVAGQTEAESQEKAKHLIEAGDPLDYRVVTSSAEAAALWSIRADGVGLAGRTEGGNPTWPGWEDAAVPPESLADYLVDFDALMDRHGVTGLPYGHFGDGCIHIRIDWPLDKPDDIPPFGAFMEEAAQVAAKYGGSLSGEHGDGRARSSLLGTMYSPEVLKLFREFKGLFDPNSVMNPGVLVDPAPLTQSLRRPQAHPLPATGFAFREDNGDITKAVHRCVGVGKCRADNSVSGGFMCPSYQATKNEKDVTRARARMLQEVANGTLISGWDSPELAESLDYCLSCKACGKDCPAGVDMSRYKAEATYQRYRGKLRPAAHYALGWLPRWASMVTAIPPVAAISNWAMNITPLRNLVFTIAGIDTRRKMTSFTTQRFSRWFRRHTPKGSSQKKDVLLWADSFSENLDPAGAKAMVSVLEDAGYTVRIPSQQACCGLTWISTGQLDGAKKRLRGLLDVLGPAAARGVPIIGIEPSCTAVLRDDLLDLLPDDSRSQQVADSVYTLAELLTDPQLGPGPDWKPPQSLAGTKIIAQPHCHQYSVMGFQADAHLLRKFGAEVEQLSGCCGLAGNFGMEKGHYDVSVAVAENALLPALRRAEPNTVFLADGYSCRTQAEQLAGVSGVSLPQLLSGSR